MRARVDPSKCRSHFVCNLIAPSIFVVDDASDVPLVRDEELDENQTDAAERAALSCPERAIIVE